MQTATLMSPDGLHKNPAFSRVAVIQATAGMLYVGGQNAVDATGSIVGKDDLAAQAEQVFANLNVALRAAGANVRDVVKWDVYLVVGQRLALALSAFNGAWGNRPNPPVVTGHLCSGPGAP